MSEARHDQAVSLLTTGGSTITLVVYREQLVTTDTEEPVFQRKSVLEVPKAQPLSLDDVATIPEEANEASMLSSGPTLQGPSLQPGPTRTAAVPRGPLAQAAAAKTSQPPVVSGVMSDMNNINSPKPLIATKPAPPERQPVTKVAPVPLERRTPVSAAVSQSSSRSYSPSTQSAPATVASSSGSQPASSAAARTSFLASMSAPVSGGSVTDQFNSLARQWTVPSTASTTTASTAGPAVSNHGTGSPSKTVSPARLQQPESPTAPPPLEVSNA